MLFNLLISDEWTNWCSSNNIITVKRNKDDSIELVRKRKIFSKQRKQGSTRELKATIANQALFPAIGSAQKLRLPGHLGRCCNNSQVSTNQLTNLSLLPLPTDFHLSQTKKPILLKMSKSANKSNQTTALATVFLFLVIGQLLLVSVTAAPVMDEECKLNIILFTKNKVKDSLNMPDFWRPKWHSLVKRHRQKTVFFAKVTHSASSLMMLLIQMTNEANSSLKGRVLVGTKDTTEPSLGEDKWLSIVAWAQSPLCQA